MTDTLEALKAQEADLWDQVQTAQVAVTSKEAEVDRANADLAALQVKLGEVQDVIRGAS